MVIHKMVQTSCLGPVDDAGASASGGWMGAETLPILIQRLPALLKQLGVRGCNAPKARYRRPLGQLGWQEEQHKDPFIWVLVPWFGAF